MKLAISADWHVDSYGSRVDPETGLNARLTDFLRTATWVAEEAKRRGADALLVLGDFSERKHINGWLIARIQEALSAGPQRVIALRGNHDGTIGGRSIVDIFDRREGWDGVDRPRVIRLGKLAICAIGFMDRHHARTLPGMEAVAEADLVRVLGEQYLAIARGLFAEAMDGGATSAILVGHQSVSGGRMSEAQEAFLGGLSLVVDSRALAAIGYSMVALGHYHLAQTVLDDPACPVVYAGSIERVDFAEAGQQKSFLMVDVDETGKTPVSIEVVPTPARRFVTLTGNDIGDWPDIEGAVVRMLDVDPEIDTAVVREELERRGHAFDITEIRRRPVAQVVPTTGLHELLTPSQALTAYFDGDLDAEALVDRGLAVLAEVA